MTADLTTAPGPPGPTGTGDVLARLRCPDLVGGVGAVTPFVADVTAVGALLPGLGVREPCDLLAGPRDAWVFDAHELLGRKGVRYKDRATLLASAACEEALRAAGRRDEVAGQGTALVVASCYGNVETVCAVSGRIAREGVGAISPMDLPNASSNVVAASLAIRFGITGVCLTVCNGHDSGWDALVWAGRLLAAGRARRVLVVGVETPSAPERLVRGAHAPPLVDGAAAVLVERGGTPASGGATAVTGRAADDRHVEWAGVGGVVDVVRAVAAVTRADVTGADVTGADASGAVTVGPVGSRTRRPTLTVEAAR